MTKYERRRASILASAAKRFNERGVKGTTLADVAADVGLSLKSLRYYFKRKDLLVAECFLQSIGTYKQLVADAAVGATPEERVRLLLTGFFRLTVDVRNDVRPPFLHFGDIWALSEGDRDSVRAAYTDMFRRVRSLLVADHYALDRRALNARAHMLLSQVLWAVVWIRRYENDQLPRVAQRMYEILLHGIAPSPQSASDGAEVCAALVKSSSSVSPQEAFLRVATRLINERGYRGASVDKIVAELQVTKGSFYHHNATKDDLVVACFERTFKIMRQAQDVASEQTSIGFDRLWSVSAALVRFQRSAEGPLLRTSALAAVPPELRVQMAGRMDNITDRFSEMLTDGMIAGVIRPCDVAIAAQMITGMINAAAELHYWLRDVDADAAVELYAGPLFSGLFSGVVDTMEPAAESRDVVYAKSKATSEGVTNSVC